MRNMIGAILGVAIGTMLLPAMLGMGNPGYGDPYDLVWFLFFGGQLLSASVSGLTTAATLLQYLIVWIVIGAIASIFSKKGWNIVRSAVWIGLIQGILSLAHTLLEDPAFWSNPNRNLDLLVMFISSILIALLIIPVAYPLTVLKEMALLKTDDPLPSKIETICECGAVFKSNPMICSECGRKLRESGPNDPA